MREQVLQDKDPVQCAEPEDAFPEGRGRRGKGEREGGKEG